MSQTEFAESKLHGTILNKMAPGRREPAAAIIAVEWKNCSSRSYDLSLSGQSPAASQCEISFKNVAELLAIID